MNKKTIILLILMLPFAAFAQENDPTEGEPFVKRTTMEGGISISSNGELSAVSLNGMQYWGFGRKNRKFKIGGGLRLTSSFGNDNLQYITAPADLTANEATVDSLLLAGTQANALNLFLALRYDVTERWGAEFNIDIAGFSFGGEKAGTLTYDDGKVLTTDGTPTAGNILLVGDNDIGNLNSEFLLTYRYKSNWRFKAGAMFIFNEYSLGIVPAAYTASNGTEVMEVQRYRSKNMTFGVGVNYVF